ncbi:MAG: MarR family winged helix-turn-helix transcriptional regulator [Candidatus Ranarchaeia archaeon]
MSKKEPECIVVRIGDGGITEVFELIDGLAKQFRRIQNRSTQKTNLTSPQFMVLRMLWDKDGQPFKDLATGSCCSRPTITGIIDALEKKGLVERVSNSEDRRSTLVKLTTNGKRQKKSSPTIDDIFETCCGGLTPEEMKTLVGLLAKLNASVVVPQKNS